MESTGTRTIPGPHGLISTQERHLEAPKHTYATHIHGEKTRNRKILQWIFRIYRDNLCARDLEIGATASKSVQIWFLVLYN